MGRPKVYDHERVRLNVRVSRTLLARLKREAVDRGMSLSELVTERLRGQQQSGAPPAPEASGEF